MSGNLKSSTLKVAQDFIKFVDAGPSPYHVVEECKHRLMAAGFTEIKEHDTWLSVKPLDKCFMTRNQSTIIAFAVGGQFRAGNGFTMFGAHTDSPCLRVKVKSSRVKQGYVQVGTECYGGGNWNSWFDRDLKIAGRLLIADDDCAGGRVIRSQLIHVNRPVMRVPHLAIHLQRDMNDKFSINKENHLVPMIAAHVDQAIKGSQAAGAGGDGCCAAKHDPVLVNMLLDEAGCKRDQLVDFDLFLADHQPSAIGGACNDFVFAPRLDNLHSCYCGLRALCDAKHLDQDPNVRLLALFDNEEVGSASAPGAGSSISEYVMRRLSRSNTNQCAFEEAVPKSMMLSADMAHAVHPNYADKHEENMRPTLTGGPVIKTNNNQRYATTAPTATVVREAARLAGVPTQDVMVRNDSACGSTIGPILAQRLAMRTCDLGGAQLSMHSCREVCGVASVEQCERVYRSYFENFPTIDRKIVLD